jgi:hypothetical protein
MFLFQNIRELVNTVRTEIGVLIDADRNNLKEHIISSSNKNQNINLSALKKKKKAKTTIDYIPSNQLFPSRKKKTLKSGKSNFFLMNYSQQNIFS